MKRGPVENPRNANRHPDQRRIRARTLVLLWIWALCIFMIVDLFLQVEEFDTIRPRVELYHAMRRVAHDMVGERISTEVVGRVTDSDGSPVPHAEISLARGARLVPGPNSVVADDDGRFEFRIGHGASWNGLVATASGYVPSRQYIHDGFQRVTLVLRRLPVIRGYVRLSGGAGPSEFEVIAAPAGSEAALRSPGPFGTPLEHSSGLKHVLRQGGDVDFLIEDLLQGGYALIIRAPGHAVVRLSGVVPEPRSTAKPIEIRLPRTHSERRR